MFIFELDIIQTLIIEEMSLFFNKNRQAGRNSQPRWQKKQTAINSHNDKFTIYAQMQPKLCQSSNNWFLQHNQNRMPSSQTPITCSKISKMKQTLTNLQLVNDAYRQPKQGQLDFDNSNGSSINNSRKRQLQIKQDYIQQQRNQADNMTRNKQSDNINKINNSFYRNPYIGSLRTEQKQGNYEQQSNYNQKLQLMKKRLQLIYQKQFKQQEYKNNNSGQNLLFSIQSPQSSIYFKNEASKNSSQQSTTRQKDKPKGLNGQVYTSKNTVPMPTIIHEDQIQELQIPSTIHLNNHVHNHNLAHRHDSKKGYQNTTNRPINNKITKGMKSISYNNTLSQKKQQDGTQFYYELYPSMSQELDMKIYKNFEEDGKNQRYNENIKNQRNQLQQMRKELQNAQKSIWLHGNITNQAGRHNQSSQSTKRKTSNYNASAQLRIPNQTKGTTPIRSRSPIQKNHLVTKGNNVSAISQNTEIQIVKVHRASIKQILFEDMQGSMQMYTASKDYSVKLYELDNQRSIINNYELYRHRGGITSLTKIDNILLSTGCDLYLKYYKVTAGRCPPDLQNMGMYKFDDCPTQLLGINQTNIMVAASKDMWLFDIHACTISRAIQKQESTLLQNGRNLYIATSDSLSIMDLRCADPIIKLSSDFPYISNWVVHPTQPIFILNSENKLLQLDMRYIKQPKKLLNQVMVLDNSQTIVNYCWSNETIAGRTRDKIQKINTLTLLTQKIEQEKIYYNSLLRLRFKDNSAHVQKQIGIHKGTIANSMNIIRENEGTYYGGDKMGSLFKILLHNKQKHQQTLDRSRNYIQYQRKYEKIHAF